MHWELSGEQDMFVAALREWVAAKFSPATVREIHDSGADESFVDALIAEGWWGVGYSESAGGQGGGLLELALAAREFGRAAVPDSRWLTAAIAAPILSPEELATQVAGERCFVLATPADRIPHRGLSAADGTSVDGQVGHVVGGADADVFLVPTGGDEWARVPAEEATVIPANLLDRSRQAASVSFTSASVSAVLPGPTVATVASRAAVLVAADALGSAERMLDLSVEYSKQRKQFGQFIGAFQAVKHAAAQMLVGVEAGYSMALYAAAALDANLADADADTAAAVAKAQVTESVAGIADSALTVHGAIGYTWEHDLQLYYKRAKLDRVLFGSPAQWNAQVAAAILA